MRSFLKQTFASLVGTFAALTLLFVLGTGGLVLLMIAAVRESNEPPQVKDKSVLVLDLTTQIRDTDPTLDVSQAFSSQIPKTFALSQLIKAIDKATRDRRIVALLLDGSRITTSETDFSTFKELRPALEKFRAAGKKIVAYGVNWGEREYYLSSVADEIAIHPMGTLEFNGLSSDQVFFTGALEKFGVGVQVVRVGKYKSAVEPFTQKQLSPASREQLENWVGDIWRDFLTSVGKSRKIAPQSLQALADTKGLLMPAEARAAKLIDRVAYFDEVVAELQKLTGKSDGEETFRQIRMETYRDVPVKEAKTRSSNNKVAIIYAEGEIVGGQGEDTQIGSDRLNKTLRKARNDEEVKAVVLRVNSPGGSATASELIAREVKLLRQKKPVILSMGNVTASGGYWIATSADYIFAQTNTITGSIGVFGLLPNIQKITNNNGITWDNVKTAKLADIETVSRPKNPQEMALYQRFVNGTYNLFLDKVAQGRKLPKAKVAQIAQGRVWSGQDAKQLGLVDRLGGLDDAIAYAAKKANLGDDWEAKEYLEEPSFESQLLKFVLQESRLSADPLTREFSRFSKDLDLVNRFNDPRGVYAFLPFDWHVH
ncbi:signal peptide peptidase SppA [Oscillatoria sp. FACHB-1406]|uniref:signal peptide peptidase SppA n=1 Tax=Oscillatoria sp. FACHB-1406 TaxID=2692846 RepID=UPI0016836116|nr:signal peptide peptidase SppA [Oscillatoria sp. FACHB-1406]MBD2576615.1 signal peptide peptidase SppA [Oscillatoria sp. FACHB-1406]